MSLDFIDTDILIQISEGRPLQEIIDTKGYRALCDVEEKIILTLNCHNHVIATGGSAVYRHAAMKHLKSEGIIVFLDVDLHTLDSRVQDYDTRGIVKLPDQNYTDLYEERLTLYKKYADITINYTDLTYEKVCQKIVEEIKKRNANQL
jgi:shikimate kinase